MTDEPARGLIVELPYIWKREKEKDPDIDEGVKDRPCIVVAVDANGVAVLPVSTQPPVKSERDFSVEIKGKDAKELGLKDPSYVVATEANIIDWPTNRNRTAETKQIKGGLLVAILEKLRAAQAAHRHSSVQLRN